MKRILVGSLLLAFALVGTSAFAEDRFASKGQMIIGAERLFGLYWTSRYWENEDSKAEATSSGLSFQLLWNANRRIDNQIPRLAFDYAVINNLTIGGSLGLAYSSGETENDPGNDVDEPSLLHLLLAPRVGYAIMFNDSFGIWPRAGFSLMYWSEEQEANNGNDVKTSEWTLGMTIEGMLVYSPATHFAFTFGPTIDLGITGNQEQDIQGGNDPEWTVRNHIVGISAGLVGYF